MKRTFLAAVLPALLAATPAAAQPFYDHGYGQGFGMGSPAAMVRNWYHRFMNRDADPEGLANWTDHIRAGMPPEVALAHFLTSSEYFRRAGGTTEGWVYRLLTDLTGSQPSSRTYQYWLYRAMTGSPRDVAYEIVSRYWQPYGGSPFAGDPYDPIGPGYGSYPWGGPGYYRR